MALACWGPDMLMHANISEMEEIMGCYLETLERRGRLVATDRTPMLESFVQFLRQFRDDHGENYDLQTPESELWQYASRDAVLCRLMQISFCVSGSFNRVYNFVDFSLPQLSSENISSMIRTISSCCQSRGVRSLQSIPDGLVAESIDAVGRAIELGGVSMDDLWNEVGRLSTDDYRQSVYERIGLNLDGRRAASPEIGGERRF